MCTTFVRSPSEIFTVNGDFALLTVQFPSHRGSNLPAVGTDNSTRPLSACVQTPQCEPPPGPVAQLSLPAVLPGRMWLHTLWLHTLWRGSRYLAGVPSIHQLEWGHASGGVCSSPVCIQGQWQVLFPVLLLLNICSQQLEQ